MKLLNSFSLNMLAGLPAHPLFEEISKEEARQLLAVGFESAVGHADTAVVFENELGLSVPAVRATVSLEQGERALIGQYIGPRLPEGAKVLPDGATIKWVLVTV